MPRALASPLLALLDVLVFVVAFPGNAAANDYPADPSSYRMRLSQLAPGDRLVLAAGTYDGLAISNLVGRAEAPIVITGPESGAPAIIAGNSCCNTVSIRDSAYVVIRRLEIDGRGELVDAVKAEGDAQFAHHITLERLHMYNFGADQQIVGVNTKCPTWDWVIRENVIENAGTGIYLGNSDGSQPFVRGVVEFNLIVNAIGYDMQIKHQNPRPALAGLPAGDSVTVIRHNVFMKYERASTGGDARPNLLVGHWPLSGPGVNDRYEIYGNFFYQNQSGTEGLFQGEGNIAFHDNILVNSFGAGLRIQPQNDVPKDISIYSNTVYTSGTGISVTGGASGFQQVVVANAVFSPEPMHGGTLSDNITDAVGAALGYVAAPSTMLGAMSFYPLPGALEGPAFDLDAFGAHQDHDRDFNGTLKSRIYRGAYTGGAAANPGWALAQAIKVLAGGPGPGEDAGVVVEPDAGIGGADAAMSGADAGMMSHADASVSPPPEHDAGPSRAPLEGGCACTGSESRSSRGGGLMLLIVGLLCLRVRGRRR